METIALLIKIIIISLASLTVVHYSGIIGELKIWLFKTFDIPLNKLRLRPLDCHICLSFWLAMLYFFTEMMENGQHQLSDALSLLLYSLSASTLSHFLYRQFK